MLGSLKRWLYQRLHDSQRLQRSLVRLGALGAMISKGSPDGVYLVFFGCNIGGAEWVHKEITFAVRASRPWVVVSHPTIEPSFLDDYRQAAGRMLDLSRFWPRAAQRLLVLGWLARLINKHPAPVVFGSLSPLFYQLLPLLETHVKRIDLTHSFDGYRELWQTPSAHYLDQRIVISRKLQDEMRTLYQQTGIPESLEHRISVVQNAVEVTLEPSPKPEAPPLRVLFVGRGTNDGGKRVNLVGQVARECAARELNIEFVLVGPGVESCLDPHCRPYVHCTGPSADPEVLAGHYRQSHLLILVSVSEGVPIAILQAMAESVIPLSTNVGAIGECIDETCGILIDTEDEAEIVAQCVEAIETLCRDASLREKLSTAAYRRARDSFSIDLFHSAYRKLLSRDEPFE